MRRCRESEEQYAMKQKKEEERNTRRSNRYSERRERTEARRGAEIREEAAIKEREEGTHTRNSKGLGLEIRAAWARRGHLQISIEKRSMATQQIHCSDLRCGRILDAWSVSCCRLECCLHRVFNVFSTCFHRIPMNTSYFSSLLVVDFLECEVQFIHHLIDK